MHGWLRPIKDTQQINVVELYGLLNQLCTKLASKGDISKYGPPLHVHCVTNVLTGKSWLNTKAVNEILKTLWLDRLISLIVEYNILVDVALMRSN